MHHFIIVDPVTGRGFAQSQTAAPDYHPGEREIPCTEEQHRNPQGWMLRDGALVTAPPLPAPLVPVPASVSSAQAKIALKRAGYLSAAKHVIDALGDEEIEIWFADARVWERSHPHVIAVAAALDLVPAQVDDLFRIAAQILA